MTRAEPSVLLRDGGGFPEGGHEGCGPEVHPGFSKSGPHGVRKILLALCVCASYFSTRRFKLKLMKYDRLITALALSISSFNILARVWVILQSNLRLFFIPKNVVTLFNLFPHLLA